MTPSSDPRFISQKERAETRAYYTSFAMWSGAALSLLLALMFFAYTDQAPPWLRNLVFQLDAAFGYPVLSIIRAMAA